ncbi:MAG: hypothetical protein GC162_09430 [Planctomycetes bacterium]|nr:hypothetical protein [Planctomycetota bacterium]
MSTTYRSSRRYRRDRTASKVAAVLMSAMFLLVAGGVWWLIRSEVAPQRSTGQVAPLFVLDTAAPVMQVQPVMPVVENEVPIEDVAAPAEQVVTTPVEIEKPVSPSAPTPAPLKPAQPMFNGRPIRVIKTMRMLVTAYSPDARSCGQFADNITASGYSVWTNGMKLVAADRRLFPFGAIVTVPGYNDGQPVPVLDRGSAIKGSRIDLLYPTHAIARQWGAKWLNVTVWEYAD